MPKGVIVGARGPHGDLSPNTPLANWFKESLKKELGIKMTTQPMHKGAMAALFLKKAYDQAVKENDAFPSTNEVIKIMEGLEWQTPSGQAKMSLGNGHQAIQDMAIGVTTWDKEEKRAKLIDIEYFDAECVNPPEGIKALDWIKSGFKGANC
jgi:branched-chain amino acid transport system substrate-binding protein